MIRRAVCYDAVATISRLLKITGLFCKRALQNSQYSANETYNFKEPAVVELCTMMRRCNAQIIYMGWLQSVGSIKL